VNFPVSTSRYAAAARCESRFAGLFFECFVGELMDNADERSFRPLMGIKRNQPTKQISTLHLTQRGRELSIRRQRLSLLLRLSRRTGCPLRRCDIPTRSSLLTRGISRHLSLR
jgi:hypothetical protein